MRIYESLISRPHQNNRSYGIETQVSSSKTNSELKNDNLSFSNIICSYYADDMIAIGSPIRTEFEYDFSNMDDSEIYDAIYTRYLKEYGDGFLKKIATFQPMTRQESEVERMFTEDLNKHLGNDTVRIERAAKKAKYGAKSDEEIRNQIASQYSTTEMTLNDFMLMTFEMSRVGLDNGARHLSWMMMYPDMQSIINSNSSSNYTNRLDMLLDRGHLRECLLSTRDCNEKYYTKELEEFIYSLLLENHN